MEPDQKNTPNFSLLQISTVVWSSAGYWLFGAALVLFTGALLLAVTVLADWRHSCFFGHYKKSFG